MFLLNRGIVQPLIMINLFNAFSCFFELLEEFKGLLAKESDFHDIEDKDVMLDFSR